MPAPVARLAVTLALTLIASTPALAAPQGGGTGGGTIYFSHITQGPALYRMNSDGSGKTLVAPVGTAAGSHEPSRLLHGGRRWFLFQAEIPGELYSNGMPRRELFAMREDANPAYTVQLTDQLDVEAGLGMRWTPNDMQVSWIARRRDPGNGMVVEGGVYAADILFDGAGDVLGLAAQPLVPSVPAQLSEWSPIGSHPFRGDMGPEFKSFDWSPSAAQIVYVRNPDFELRLAAAGSGATSLVLSGTVAHSVLPVWSPDGSKIAFAKYSLANTQPEITTITPTGTNMKRIAKSSPTYSVVNPMWSPTGSHVLYMRFVHGVSNNNTDIYRVSATGSGPSNLTSDIDNAQPIGWR